ncbi:MAG TPA: O-antigen ligase family protein [Candidatus Nitrosocosmicus sp.]|nr:O-antigen ligase family protein [Candidatus Nitrosocosmicus sp.]
MKQFNNIILSLFLFLLPTQLGKHFFFDFSYINGIKIDYLSLILYLTDILAALLVLINLQNIIPVIARYKKYFLVFIFLLFINFLFSQYRLLSLYHSVKIVELILVFIIFTQNIQNKNKYIFLLFIIGGCFELILSVFQMYTQGSLQGIFYFFGERYFTLQQPGIAKASYNGVEFLRAYGTFSHPNSLGGFYLLLYFFFLTVGNLRKHLLIKYSGLFIFSLLIFLSFSKIVIITYVILNIFYLFKFTDFKCLFCKFARIIVLFVLAALVLSMQHDPLSGQKRLDLFSHALIILKNNILFGVGLGHYLYAEVEFVQKYSYFFLQPVHNIFLLFLSQAGVLLTGFIVFVLYKLFFHHKSYILNIPSYSLCLIAVTATGMFDHYWITLQQNWLLMGVVFGLIFSQRSNNVISKF